MTWFLVAAIMLAAVAAYTDWQTGHIPNWLTYGAMAAAPFAHLVVALVHHLPREDAIIQGSYSFLGGLVCALVPVFLYNRNGLGGGDVKLFIAIGAVAHTLVGMEIELYGFFAAAIFAALRLAYDGKLFHTVSNAAFIAANPFLPPKKRREVLPETMTWFRMGPGILAGALFTAFLHRGDH